MKTENDKIQIEIPVYYLSSCQRRPFPLGEGWIWLNKSNFCNFFLTFVKIYYIFYWGYCN